MIKATCASCGKMKCIFIKKGGSIDIHKAMLPLLPKKGLTLLGHGNPLDNGLPVNELDEICMNHDYCYDTNSSKHDCDCDKKMLSNLKNSKSKSFREKIAKNLIVQPAINMKYKLGLGLKKLEKGVKKPPK